MRLLSFSSFGPSAARRFAASAAESPVAEEPSCASTSSADSLCQILPCGCAAPAGAAGAGAAAAAGFGAAGVFVFPMKIERIQETATEAGFGAGGVGTATGASGEGFGAAATGVDGGAADTAWSCCPPPAEATGAAVDAFGPAVSGVEAEAGPACGDGLPVSLCAGSGSDSLTCTGSDSPADL